jgi:hypothetical protein
MNTTTMVDDDDIILHGVPLEHSGSIDSQGQLPSETWQKLAEKRTVII